MGHASSPVALPVRDGNTWLTYGQLCLWAWFTYAFGSTVALLRDEQGTTPVVSGLHGSLLALTGVIAGLLASRLIDRLGRGRVLRLASLGAAAGVTAYLWPEAPVPVTLLGALGCGFFGTLLVITVNAYLLSHQGAAGPASLTEANALASVSGLLAPLAVGLGAATILGWRSGLAIVIVGLIVVEIVRGRRTAQFGTPRPRSAERPPAPPRRIYWSLALIVCFLGIEFSMILWSADLVRERADFGPAAAAASLAAVTGGMAIGRFAGSRLAEHRSVDWVLRVSVIIALIGFAITWVSASGAVMLTGLLVTGLGLGVHWPLGVSRTVMASGGMTDRMSAWSSIAGAVSTTIVPFTLGALATDIGFHAAFLIVPALLVIALVILIARPETDAPR